MVAFRLPRFWPTAPADSVSDGSSLRTTAVTTDDDEDTDDEDSFFDLVLKSPDRAVAVEGERETPKKDLQVIESPRDFFSSKRDFPKSPGKLKVFMLRLVKSPKCDVSSSPRKMDGRNCFSVKCRINEVPPTAADASVFVRDKSLRSQMLTKDDFETSSHKSTENSILKCLKAIKPLYQMVSKRMNEKEKFTSFSTPSSSPGTAAAKISPKRFYIGCRAGSFKIVTNQLGKSRSTSSSSSLAPCLARRSNDSLLEQQHDGIQSAILHCKKIIQLYIPRIFRGACE